MSNKENTVKTRMWHLCEQTPQGVDHRALVLAAAAAAGINKRSAELAYGEWRRKGMAARP